MNIICLSIGSGGNHSIYASSWKSTIGKEGSADSKSQTNSVVKKPFSMEKDTSSSDRSSGSSDAESVSKRSIDFPSDHYPLVWSWSDHSVAAWDVTCRYLPNVASDPRCESRGGLSSDQVLQQVGESIGDEDTVLLV